MKRFIKNILSYTLVAFVLLQVIGFVSLYTLRKSSFYKPSFIANTVSEKYFDYVILGSSTGLTTLNSSQIDNLTGLQGLNISIDDTSMSSHYLMLQHFLKSEKSTNQLILTISPGDIGNTQPKLSGNDYRFLPFVSSDYVQEYYASFSSKEAQILKMSKYFPFVGAGYYNAELFFPSIITITQPEKRNRFDASGNYVYPTTGGVTITSKKITTLEVANPYFKKIKTLCKENSIELIVYQPPIANQRVLGTIENIPFINHSDLVKDSSFFYDTIHVNAKGRDLASKAVAPALK